MREIKNLPQFLALIDRYETITIEEITSIWDKEPNDFFVKQELTGFGHTDYCPLCNAISFDKTQSRREYGGCVFCVWGNIKTKYGMKYGCSWGKQSKSYLKIEDAQTPEKLLAAYRNRAKHMRQFLIDNDIK